MLKSSKISKNMKLAQTTSDVAKPYTIHFENGAAPVRRTVGALTRRVHQISMAMTEAAVAKTGLTSAQYGAMGSLNREDGEPGIDQVGLAKRLGIDRNSASVLITELEAKGYVERRLSKADRRVRLLHLTPAGERAFLQLREDVLAGQARTLETLTLIERELLLDLLTRVIADKGQYAKPGIGRRKRGPRKISPEKGEQISPLK